MIRVRREQPDDFASVYEVESLAFERRAEADLVDALRNSVEPSLSLVAERDGVLVGHVFFSPVRVDRAPEGASFGALAPLAVEPAVQGSGVGSALVRAGLAECSALGWQAVFLLGEPAYYSRFGFELAAPRDLHYVSELFDPGFQVIGLAPGALAGCGGLVHYPEAFAAL